MKISEVTNSVGTHSAGGYSKPKAGIIPYFADGTALFFLSNNAAFGGTEPSIAKGRIDKDETPEEAAIREGFEEIGLKSSNFKGPVTLLWTGTLTGMDATYEMSVYAVEVKSKTDFAKAGKETGSTKWLTLDEYKKEGRQSQWHIVKKISSLIKKKSDIMSKLRALVGRKK